MQEYGVKAETKTGFLLFLLCLQLDLQIMGYGGLMMSDEEFGCWNIMRYRRRESEKMGSFIQQLNGGFEKGRE